ncbi:hypothetical protein HN587_05040 [Candidatus Woesearchaeota archaeon]|jgi:hypothetical protein|nr:hypothetical protein [Candidatus Woesearchaeota archaeon]
MLNKINFFKNKFEIKSTIVYSFVGSDNKLIELGGIDFVHFILEFQKKFNLKSPQIKFELVNPSKNLKLMSKLTSYLSKGQNEFLKINLKDIKYLRPREVSKCCGGFWLGVTFYLKSSLIKSFKNFLNHNFYQLKRFNGFEKKSEIYSNQISFYFGNCEIVSDDRNMTLIKSESEEFMSLVGEFLTNYSNSQLKNQKAAILKISNWNGKEIASFHLESVSDIEKGKITELLGSRAPLKVIKC